MLSTKRTRTCTLLMCECSPAGQDKAVRSGSSRLQQRLGPLDAIDVSNIIWLHFDSYLRQTFPITWRVSMVKSVRWKKWDATYDFWRCSWQQREQSNCEASLITPLLSMVTGMWQMSRYQVELASEQYYMPSSPRSPRQSILEGNLFYFVYLFQEYAHSLYLDDAVTPRRFNLSNHDVYDTPASSFTWFLS